MFSSVNPWRGARLGALVAGAMMVFAGLAEAAPCRLEWLTGQWQHKTDQSRWAFFSTQVVDCRTCKDWGLSGGCRYVPDVNDEQGRQQCTYDNGREVTKIVPTGKVTVKSWQGKDGVLDSITFSDGTTHDVSKSCTIDGASGVMTIPAIGEFQCHYNYQCTKLEREAK